MTTTALTTSLPADWRDFFALTKPRVMRSVVFTGLCGMIAAPVSLPPALAFTAVLCIAMAAGAAGALNQWYEADIDAMMRRTASRPLAAGRMDRQAALHFGVGLGVASVLIMGLATNLLAAALLAGSILFYVLIYTVWLKRITPQNIVIGGAAGAFPPLIGWVAATGQVDLLPVLMFTFIFLWTPPHSWALALRIRDDYAAGTVPMMPVVASARSTRLQMLGYAVLMAIVAVAPWPLGLTGAFYGMTALIGSMIFLAINIRVVTDAAPMPKDMRSEKLLFLYSIGYMLVTFAALALDRTVFA
ncbi:heme o synthase [Sphingomonas sp. SUN039]|uniref:heme o synthase n=1 Tax=Sphingomonas sp. SUN039 TaxID=2937787 RepID=UPI00216452C5|nr:heme o synthase [Sphingomonas sp. SUN039]UVO55085.1 heme o synthase [Sphingomonas sp. SUN039]